MLKLDKNRPYAILFDGDRQMQFHYQDGKMFDMSTDDEVDLDSIAVKPKPAITCRFCSAKRETAEMMHEHLIAKHGFQMKQAKAKPETVEETEAKAETKVEPEPENETAGEPTNPETPEEKAEAPKKKPTKSKKKENENA